MANINTVLPIPGLLPALWYGAMCVCSVVLPHTVCISYAEINGQYVLGLLQQYVVEMHVCRVAWRPCCVCVVHTCMCI